MPNNITITVIIFFSICVTVFSHSESLTQDEISSFIGDFYWYRKYLPKENLSEYYTLRNAIIYQKENNTEDIDLFINDVSESILNLRIQTIKNIEEEKYRVKIKIRTLVERYKTNEDVIALSIKLNEFEENLNNDNFPKDDSCIEEIDELYTQLITRLSYILINKINSGGSNNELFDRYLVERGDYLNKIAKKFYNKNYLWRYIYNENKNNKNFLPNHENPHLIYPGVWIIIPKLP